jgi:hypothetical protein
MKLIAENPPFLQYIVKDPNDAAEVWYYGDYLRKITMYMKDSQDAQILHCEIDKTQNTEWPTTEIHAKALKRCENDIRNYIGTNEKPFIL